MAKGLKFGEMEDMVVSRAAKITRNHERRSLAHSQMAIVALTLWVIALSVVVNISLQNHTNENVGVVATPIVCTFTNGNVTFTGDCGLAARYVEIIEGYDKMQYDLQRLGMYQEWLNQCQDELTRRC